MAFKKGHKKMGGRAPGTSNKLTQSVKESFGEAFELLGGAKALHEWAKNNKTDFYKLASKLIPADVNMAVTQTPKVSVYPKKIDGPGFSPTSETMDSLH